VESLQQEVDALKKAASDTDGIQQKLREELVSLGALKVESDRRAASLMGEVQRLSKDAGDLRLNWQTGRTDREQLVEKLSAKETEIRHLEEKIAQQRESEKFLRAKAEDAVKAMVAAQEKSQTLSGECDRLSAQLARVNTDLGVAHEQLRQARQEREAVKASVGSVQIELEQGLDQLHAVESERDALKTELEAVKAGLERAKQHVNVLQQRRDQMRDEIAKLKVQLGQAPDAVN
jgi:chromosome segregation ATPase